MPLPSRSLATAGVVLAGVSGITATPVAAAVPDVQIRAVQLTTFDPTTGPTFLR